MTWGVPFPKCDKNIRFNIQPGPFKESQQKKEKEKAYLFASDTDCERTALGSILLSFCLFKYSFALPLYLNQNSSTLMARISAGSRLISASVLNLSELVNTDTDARSFWVLSIAKEKEKQQE